MATLNNCTILNYIETQYVGVQNVDKQYVARQQHSEDMPINNDKRLAALSLYVPKKECVVEIATQLAMVKCAQDFKLVVRKIYDMCETQQQRSLIVSQPFREALMAFVTDWKISDDGVYRQTKEVFDGKF